MLYGTLSLLASFLSPKLSKVLFSIPYVQLKLFEWVVEFFGSIEWGYLDVSNSWIGLVIGTLLLLFCILFYPFDQENYYVKKFKDI
jgi:hypothetical protein